MTRLNELNADAAPALAERITRERGGKLLSLYRVLLHSPKVAEAWLQFFTVIRQQCGLDARAREAAILQVAVLNRARYEFEQHIPFALAAGMTEAMVEAIRHEGDAPGFTAQDRAVLAYARAMTRDIQVPDDVFGAVRAHFDDSEIVELTTTIAGYNMVSRFLEAMEIHTER